MKKLLLTSNGIQGNIKEFFLTKIDKRVEDIKVIYVPNAAIHMDMARELLAVYLEQLLELGIQLENITIYNLQYLLSYDYKRAYSSQVKEISPLLRLMTVEEMNQYDMIVFTGGESTILLQEINRTGFNITLNQAVDNGLFYVGISAGSMIAAGNLPNNLGYLKQSMIPHCKEGTSCENLSLCSEIYLSDEQAIFINDDTIMMIK